MQKAKVLIVMLVGAAARIVVLKAVLAERLATDDQVTPSTPTIPTEVVYISGGTYRMGYEHSRPLDGQRTITRPPHESCPLSS